MKRKPLLEMLERYRAVAPEEGDCVDRIVTLVRDNEDCFERTCAPGHITASSWILSSCRTRVLLTHHRKLGRWLQLGGHADGETEVLAVALREAREESGMHRFEVLSGSEPLVPMDVDVHRIPARPGEPEHEHHDIRFLLVAEPGQELVISDESNALRWFPASDLDRVLDEESLWRLQRKAAWAMSEDGSIS